jgi:PfaD family protein
MARTELSTRACAAYGAARCTHHPASGDPVEAEGPGGGLTLSVEHHGVGALAAALEEGERFALQDEDVELHLARVDGRVQMRVRWSEGPTYEERLQVAPDGGTALGSIGGEQLVEMEPSSGGIGDPVAALHDPERPLGLGPDGLEDAAPGAVPAVPAVSPGSLGAGSFRAAHGVRGNLVAGAMAGGIASVDMVAAMADAGLMGFFGAGGLPLSEVEAGVAALAARVGDRPWGANLLHNPAEPEVEERTVDLYLQHGVRRVSASAFMRLTPAIVRYRLTGIREDAGRIVTPNKVFAKVSRPEVAAPFMRPAPSKIVAQLVEAGVLTQEQAALAARVPMAEDVTAEADSGGHTDRRPLVVLLPTLLRLRDRIVAEEQYAREGLTVRVGAAGGIGDPAAAHAAFSLGADYVLTGSINQATVEAGTSELAKVMIAAAGMADCATGPAPDMFELGAHVQVLGQGTMYAQRAGRLYDLYKRCASMDEIPAADRKKIEKQIFRRPLDEVWADTRAYWQARDPAQVARADRDPRHQMALTFRWYLGMTSRWARIGDADRRRDFQIWCGPSMGLFNDWVHGTALDPLQARTVGRISWALLHGAAALSRVHVARALGVRLPARAAHPAPVG